MKPTQIFSLVSALLLSGCLDWQGSYTAAARDQCREIINADERLECMRWVAENDTARRAERRREASSDEKQDVVDPTGPQASFP